MLAPHWVSDLGEESVALERTTERRQKTMYAVNTVGWIVMIGLGMFGCSGAQLDDRPQTTEPTVHTASLTTAKAEPVSAAPVPEAEPKRHGKARLLERFDANGNGTIEVAEIPERLQQRLAGADSNMDGILSTEELRAHKAEMRAKKLAKLTSQDTDQDGALSLSEVGKERWTRLSKADADQDGKVTFTELAQARERGALRRRHH
jgi:Ca2+-binding EF-hand superfamily protein